jgi:hypothetical protein
MGIVCPKCKEGDMSKCDNYRGIMLSSCIDKVLSNISNRQNMQKE